MVEATGWQVVENLACETLIYISFASPDMKLLGYGSGDDRFTVMETTG